MNSDLYSELILTQQLIVDSRSVGLLCGPLLHWRLCSDHLEQHQEPHITGHGDVGGQVRDQSDSES